MRNRFNMLRTRVRWSGLLVPLIASGLLLSLTLVVAPVRPPPDHSSTDPAPSPARQSRRLAALSAPTPATVQEAVAVTELLRRYLDAHFGAPGTAASWYENIRDLNVGTGTAVIRTDLSTSPEDLRKAQAIAGAVALFPYTDSRLDGRPIRVLVYGQGDALLAADDQVRFARQRSDDR